MELKNINPKHIGGAIIAILLVFIVVYMLIFSGGDVISDDDDEIDEVDGPEVGERDTDDSRDETTPDEEEDEQEVDEDELSNFDFPTGASEDGLDWNTVVNEHYSFVRTEYQSINEEFYYESDYQGTLEITDSDHSHADGHTHGDDGDHTHDGDGDEGHTHDDDEEVYHEISGFESVEYETIHTWENGNQYHTILNEEASYPDSENQQEVETFLHRDEFNSVTQYQKMTENGDTEITSDEDVGYRFTSGTAVQGLSFVEIDFDAVGVERENDENVVIYDATIEDNEELVMLRRHDSLPDAEQSLEELDVRVVLTEDGELRSVDYRAEIEEELDGETITRVETIEYDYTVNSVDLTTPEWVENERN